MAKQNNKQRIILRYGVVMGLFALITMAIVYKLVDTTIVRAPEWNERARKELSKIDTIAPERGDILASNGNILACNLKVYDIRLDCRHKKFTDMNPFPWKSLDSLADALDEHFPRVANLKQHADTFEKYTWRRRLREEFEKPVQKRTSALRIARQRTIEDFEMVRTFPMLKNIKGRGFRYPLYKEERNIRIYPYGKMAYRSIGRVNESELTGQIHGYSGLEKDLDSLLYGTPGLAKKVALTKGIGNWVTTPPKRGYDIVTTIDIDLQDMLEQELLSICQESNAEWGTAILMEVETGEIKAISNIERLGDGTFGEALNRAVIAFEPGSVMKPISMMIAFEDGLVKSVNDGVDCSPFQRTKDPHAPGYKTMKQVIEMSSNTGIARVIFRGYGQNPEKFYDRLESIGLFDPMRSGIAEEERPRVARLVDKTPSGLPITMTARHLDLARQAYGYNTVIPPLYTLSYYNAIANKGKYVRPHLVKALRDENGRDSAIKIDYIRHQVCSEETAEKVKQCIHEVVWGEHGTARAVRDDRVKVVGKTGTAYPMVPHKGYDTSKRRYAFAGFFPYDKPKYSCMALVMASAGTSANRTSGQVVKNMAVKMYSHGLLDGNPSLSRDGVSSVPVASASTEMETADLTSALSTRKIKRRKGTPPAATGKASVPDVVGYDLRSAVKILEEKGYNARIAGRGTGSVRTQSHAAGSHMPPGTVITLTLR